jgi:hypothetical protein
MKAIVENPLLDMRAYAASLFVEILNEITACKNEEELRRCVRLLENAINTINQNYHGILNGASVIIIFG